MSASAAAIRCKDCLSTLNHRTKYQRQQRRIAQQLNEFSARFRPALATFAKRSPRHADLLFTSPVAALSLATRRGLPEAREQADWLIESGIELSAIEQTLKIPRWMRRLPPQIYKHRLAEDLAGFHVGHEFGRRVLNTVPEESWKKSIWLQWILQAHEACDDEFSLWIASAFNCGYRLPAIKHLAPLAAYAWYSKHPEHSASALLRQPWSKAMAFRSACEQTYEWMMPILLNNCIDHHARLGIWAKPRRIQGVEIVPLLSSNALIMESYAMSNCIDQYRHDVLADRCRLYSLRINGALLADLEVIFAHKQPHLGEIVQIRAPRNKQPTIETMKIAELWLKEQNAAQEIAVKQPSHLPLKQSVWDSIWAPYWRDKGPRGILVPCPATRPVLEFMRAIRPAHFNTAF